MHTVSSPSYPALQPVDFSTLFFPHSVATKLLILKKNPQEKSGYLPGSRSEAHIYE
jgi:hypothetical protein